MHSYYSITISLRYILHPPDYCVTTNLYLLIPPIFPLTPNPPFSWQLSKFSLYLWVCLGFISLFFLSIPHISEITLQLFLSDTLHSAQYPRCPSMVLQMEKYPFASMAEQYSIVYMYHLIFIHSPSMDTLAVSITWPLQAVLSWIYGCTCPIELAFWVSLDKYTEVELLGPSFSFVATFVLKSILSGIYIATPVFLRFHFQEIPLIPLLSGCVCLSIWSGSLADSIYMGLAFLSTQLCYVFRLDLYASTFKMITDGHKVTAICYSYFLSCFFLFFLKKFL